MTFHAVRDELQYEAQEKYNRGQYMFFTRHTILGRWREYKKKQFESVFGIALQSMPRSYMIDIICLPAKINAAEYFGELQTHQETP